MINLLEKNVTNPIPTNEMERLIAPSNLDLDYMDLEESLSDLTKLAAKIAGTEISLFNLIDNYTQWSVSSFGFDIRQMPRLGVVTIFSALGGICNSTLIY